MASLSVDQRIEAGPLAGVGLGGGHALFTRPDQFSTYLAISPSLWFGGDLLAREERQLASGAARPTVLIAAGSAEGGPAGGGAPAGEALAARLRHKGVEARYLPLPGQGHGATMFAAMGQAIATAFKAPEVRP